MGLTCAVQITRPWKTNLHFVVDIHKCRKDVRSLPEPMITRFPEKYMCHKTSMRKGVQVDIDRSHTTLNENRWRQKIIDSRYWDIYNVDILHYVNSIYMFVFLWIKLICVEFTYVMSCRIWKFHRYSSWKFLYTKSPIGKLFRYQKPHRELS